MLKTIIGTFAFFCMYICVFSVIGDNLSFAVIASMFANIFYITFLFIEEEDDDDDGTLY